MIYVVATIQITAGHRDEFLAKQKHLLPLVWAEAGCVEYVPSVEVAASDPPARPLRDNVVVMHEKWETLAALHAHSRAPHMLAFREEVEQLVMGVNIEVFESV